MKKGGPSALPLFGSTTPYSEPPWYRGTPSPYYNQTHVELRSRVRAFVDAELLPNVDEWEERCVRYGEEIDVRGITRAAAKAGILAPMYPESLGGTPLPNGTKFDSFHDLVWIDELSRTGASGLIAAITIWTMALPPVIRFANEEVRNRIVPGVLRGEKTIALCITEPTAGSDVAGLSTTAIKTPDGKFYKVNGQKKWITNAIFADYFTVAVRTGGPGHKGVSVLVIDRDSPGIEIKRMKLQGNWVAGTGYVTFDDVLVPVGNLLGKEGEGFKIIVQNLQHERLVIAVQALRMARLAIQDSVEFARERKTFGKRLIDHQVIRHKIMNMASQVEAGWSMAEGLAYSIDHGVSEEVIAGPMALLKVVSSFALEVCVRESAQILGGAAYTREGKGQRIERIGRELVSYKVPGGSVEALLDYAASRAKL